jgi:ribonuclease P protein component
MLAAPNRLKKNVEINRVYTRGVYGGAGGPLSIKALQTKRPQARGVVVVSKKIDKRAVVRNKIRRRLSAVLATIWKTVPSGYDIVVSVHTDVSKLPTHELTRLVSKALISAHVISR